MIPLRLGNTTRKRAPPAYQADILWAASEAVDAGSTGPDWADVTPQPDAHPISHMGCLNGSFGPVWAGALGENDCTEPTLVSGLVSRSGGFSHVRDAGLKRHRCHRRWRRRSWNRRRTGGSSSRVALIDHKLGENSTLKSLRPVMPARINSLRICLEIDSLAAGRNQYRVTIIPIIPTARRDAFDGPEWTLRTARNGPRPDRARSIRRRTRNRPTRRRTRGIRHHLHRSEAAMLKSTRRRGSIRAGPVIARA